MHEILMRKNIYVENYEQSNVPFDYKYKYQIFSTIERSLNNSYKSHWSRRKKRGIAFNEKEW